MSLLRIAGLLSISALVACASTNPLDEDGGGPPVDQPDASKDIIDADPGAPDAPPKPDAAPADAFVPPPDAAVDATPPPDAMFDAAPCTPTTTNLLADPGFDVGPSANWTQSGTAEPPGLILAGADLKNHAPHSPTYALWLGGYDSANETLTQTVTIPASATGLRFKGQRWVETAEAAGTTIYDKVTFEIVPASGSPELLGGSPAFSNVNTTTTWTAFDFPVSGNYAGQTVTLRFHATTDPTGLFGSQTPTSFFIDTIALEATVCQ